MSKRANRVGLANNQVDVYGRIKLAKKQLTQIIASLPRWTDFKVFKNGTEQILPVNTSEPSTSPIIADIDYPDDRRNDQSFLYRVSPTKKDGRAWIRNIKGNTVSFNQILPINTQASTTINGVTFTNNNDGSITANGTASANAGFSQGNWGTTSDFAKDIKSRGGHKIIVIPNSKNYDGWDVALRVQGFITDGTSVSVNQPIIYELPSNISTFNTVQVYPIILSGKTANNFYCKPMILDLTVMGIDNLTTTAEVEAWLSSHIGDLPYYDYTQGTLIPFNGTGLKTVGKNILNYNIPNETINGVTITNNNGVITLNGSSTTTFSKIINVFLKKGTYKISGAFGNSDFYKEDLASSNRFFISANGNYFDNVIGGRQFTISEDGTYNVVLVIVEFSESGVVFNNSIIEPMIRLADADDTFEPYISNTLSLPTLTYFETGMKSAGEVYDEIDPETNKVYTRVGSVDLGSVNYTYETSGVTTPDFLVSDNVFADVIKKPDNNSTKANILCAKYKTETQATLTGTSTLDKIISFGTGGALRIKDLSYSDATTFKTAMSGVMLYYELATPTEEPIIELD